MIKKKYDKIVLLGKSNLDLIEFLIYKSLIDTSISHNYFFFLIINVWGEYNEMKQEIKNPETSVEYII